jgi:glycosyltransferase involved in cell wall biosynthesis
MIVLASQFRKSLRDMGYSKPIYLETTLVSDEVFEISTKDVSCNGAMTGINILFLSRVEKNKGVYEVIDAFNRLKNNHSSLTMTLAGDGSELLSARKYIESNKIPGIEITGWLDGEAKRNAFRKADIYLFPTKHGEGMPNSVLEAMAYGLPVITSSVGGVKDFFQDGKMGYLADGNSQEKIVEVCEMLIKDRKKRSDIGKFNREYAKEHFIASNVCRRLENIYDEIVLQNKSPKNPKSLTTQNL